MAGHEIDGWDLTAEVLRAEEPTRARSWHDRWGQPLFFTAFTIRTYIGVVWQDWPWWVGLVPVAALLGILAQRAWSHRRPAPVTPWVTLGPGGLTRSEAPEVIGFDELARIDGHERWPNLRLHTRTAQVDLFPWSATEDDAAAAAVATAVLERASAAGVDTRPRPIAMWRPTRHEIDWDRAVVPPSRRSRRGPSSSPPA